MSEILLDRKLQPKMTSIGNIPFEFPEKILLDNKCPLHIYRDFDSEVLRIEFQFPAGTINANKRLDAVFTNKLITSGTSELSEREISEKIDFYGAYFEKHIGNDEASFTIYSLRKYASDVLNIVAAILNDPIFPEDELETLLHIKKQKFLVKSEKVSFLAKREFNNALFGKNHAYGGKTKLEHFDELQRHDLLSFHKNHYTGMPVIMASGNIDDALVKEINQLFGKVIYSNINGQSSFQSPVMNNERIILEKKDAVQSAIHIGRIMFNRGHELFPEMQVLNTVLGGYFGSRLMSNLREDKGYTYGVGSGLASLLQEGYFFISTEVSAEATLAAEKEIKSEMKKLQEELIPEGELNLVKNYLLGQILKSTDGVFARMNRFKTLHLFHQNEDDFQSMINGIRSAQPKSLQSLANEWFNAEEMLTVIAGKAG